jgi:hypothetical protein
MTTFIVEFYSHNFKIKKIVIMNYRILGEEKGGNIETLQAT